MSLLNTDSPEFMELIEEAGIEILWHPSFSNQSANLYSQRLSELLNDERTLDILCVEGFVITGPDGSGQYDLYEGRPKLEIIRQLAQRARYVLAIGTCASYGGVGSIGPTSARGLQFDGSEPGGAVYPGRDADLFPDERGGECY